MNALPQDIFMLVSSVNMLLRDREYEDLDDICACFDENRDELEKRLLSAGFRYDASLGKIV